MSRQQVFSTAVLSLLLLTTAGAAAAAGPIADVSLKGSAIDFALNSEISGSVTLNVTGSLGYQYQQTFEAGVAPFLSAFDEAGQSLAAGLYKWNLSVNRTAEGDRPAVGSRHRPLTQSGSFTILEDGSLADPDLPEGGLNKDQQILDDLIVAGSACIGLDCNNGESFGFDTLRLKENNLRIRAQDTSTSASFPSRDWQITFNDTSNGGKNKFSIDDIDGGRTPFTIEAGAPSDSLYVEDGGRLGLGTSTPVTDIHVKSGNTPTMRLEQDGTSGFGAQTWDVAGNEANFFIRDASNGSTLPFRIFPGAPSNAISIEATTGDVGLGTTSPDSNLDIEGDGPSLRLTNIGTGAGGWRFSMNGNSGRLTLRDLSTDTDVVRFEQGSNAALLRVGIDTGGNADVDAVSIGATGGGDAVLQVQGSVVVNGTPTHPDYVFDPDFELRSIEDHAAFMWQNKHLPALPKAPEGLKGPVDLVAHQMGILEELETAHVYIEQLQGNIDQLQETITQLASEVEQLKQK